MPSLGEAIVMAEGFQGDQLQKLWLTYELEVSEDHANPSPTPGLVLAGAGCEGGVYVRNRSTVFRPLDEICFHMSFRCRAGPAGVSNTGLLDFMDASGDITAGINITQDGFLVGASGNDPGGDYQERGTGDVAVTNDVFHNIEVYVKRHPTDGVIIAQLDGVAGVPGETGYEALVIEGIPTGNLSDIITGFNAFDMGRLGGNIGPEFNFSFADIVVSDGSYGFLGPMEVYAAFLQGDREVRFIRSGGALNKEMVEELLPDDTDTVNRTVQDGAFDILTIGATPPGGIGGQGGGQIFAVQLCVRAHKTMTQAWTLRTLTALGSQRLYGTDRWLGYHGFETFPVDVYPYAPGFLQWSRTRLNQLGVGYIAEQQQESFETDIVVHEGDPVVHEGVPVVHSG